MDTSGGGEERKENVCNQQHIQRQRERKEKKEREIMGGGSKHIHQQNKQNRHGCLFLFALVF